MVRLVKRMMKSFRAAYLRVRGVSVGKDTKISFGAWIDTAPKAKVTIGNKVIISHGVKILAHDWALSRMGLCNFDDHYQATTIEDDVFIGMNVIVLPGVTVRRGSILAAGAVVTKDVPASTLVGGNPARVLKAYNPESKSWEVRT